MWCRVLVSKGVHEIGVIERFAAVFSGVDGSLEPRDGDDFLSWLRSQGFGGTGSSGAGGRDRGEVTAAEADDGGPDGEGGVERNSQGAAGGEATEGAKRRAEVEAFLSAAAARLNALVAEKEESLFGDRGEAETAATVEGGGDAAEGKGAASGGAAAVSPNMSEEDLYQVRGEETGEALLFLGIVCVPEQLSRLAAEDGRL